MSNALTILLQGAHQTRRERLPWHKAYGVSVGSHALLLLLLLTLSKEKIPLTVLTEVKFIEAEEMTASSSARPGADVKGPEAKVGTGNGFADAQPLKSNIDMHTSGDQPLSGSSFKGESRGATGAGAPGAALPLSGPIVATEPIGWVGKKRGALIELPERRGGIVGSGTGGNAKEGKLAEPIALGKMGVDELRKKEAVIGAPLISGQVVAKSVSSSGFGGTTASRLADSSLGQKRKSAVESLKANPIDADKWGKSDALFSMEGPLKYRKILKMELPPYPRWAEEQAIEAAVSVRLWVDSKGLVLTNMYLEKTSGYSELDQLAMDALKQFLFIKLPDNQSQEDEWGVATFRYKLKK